MTGAPCSACGEPGVRSLGVQWLCLGHATDFYRRCIPPEAWMEAGGGIGLPVAARPDHGDGYFDVECSACGAGWTDAALTRCPWCQELLELMREWAAEALLKPPDVDTMDRNWEPRMRAWADRLAAAVVAGTVTRQRADAAWRREVGGERAA